MSEFCRRHNLEYVRHVRGLDDVFVARFSSKEQRKRSLKAVQEMERDEGVHFVEILVKKQQHHRGSRHHRQVVALPTDPLFQEQWHLPVIKAEQAWQMTRGEGSVVQLDLLLVGPAVPAYRQPGGVPVERLGRDAVDLPVPDGGVRERHHGQPG